MTNEEFKAIHTYLSNRKYLGKKWTGEDMARALVRTRQSVQMYEKDQEVPEIVADRMMELLAECAILEIQEEIFNLVLYKVARPEDIQRIKEKLNNL